MPRERKRKANEPIQKGIPIAEPGSEVIFNDPVLKSPFISNPFISRLKGRAYLEQCLAYNLYFDDLTQKWKPLSDISISTVKNLARFYPTDPPPPTVLSDLPLRLNEYHELEVIDVLNKNTLEEVKSKLDGIITTLNTLYSGFIGESLIEESTTETSYTLIKEIINTKYIEKFRVIFSFSLSGAPGAKAKFYINGAGVGIEREHAGPGYATYTELFVIILYYGDKLQIYGSAPNGTCFIKDFKVSGR